MRKKEIFTCKEDLDNVIDSFIQNGLIQVRADGENAAFQIVDEVNSSQIPSSPESIDAGTENAEKNHVQQNKEKDCTTMETLKYDPNWVKLVSALIFGKRFCSILSDNKTACLYLCTLPYDMENPNL